MANRSKSRREMLGLLGLATGAAAVYPLLSGAAAGALLADPPVFPGQVGAATSYTTAKGTACWALNVYAGTGADLNDNYHYTKVLVPQSLDVTVATPTVLVVHGATALEDCITRGGGVTMLAQSWLDLGWAVIATREGSTVTATGNGANGKWGNEPSRKGMADAWRWVRTAWTPDPHGFLVFGFSMGGLGGLNFAAEARRQRLPIAAVYGVDSATNLADCSVRNVAFHKQIKAAYALPNYQAGDANWSTKVDVADGGHDPNKFVAGLMPFPLRLAASPNDTTVKITFNTTMFYNLLRAAGWGAELSVLTYSGGHCAAKHFLPKDVNPFFLRALSRVNQAPLATFTHEVTGTAATFDGSASRDVDGYIVDAAWDFGDGATASGLTAAHDFGVDGDYTVSFSLTDDRGAVGTASTVLSIVTADPPLDPPPEP